MKILRSETDLAGTPEAKGLSQRPGRPLLSGFAPPAWRAAPLFKLPRAHPA